MSRASLDWSDPIAIVLAPEELATLRSVVAEALTGASRAVLAALDGQAGDDGPAVVRTAELDGLRRLLAALAARAPALSELAAAAGIEGVSLSLSDDELRALYRLTNKRGGRLARDAVRGVARWQDVRALADLAAKLRIVRRGGLTTRRAA